MEHNAIGLARGALELRPYDPQWTHAFERERAVLLEHVPHLAGVEHVGSTSVPGLEAKPIIDMQASLQHLTDVDLVLPGLTELGYTRMADRAYPSRVFLPKGPEQARTHYLSLIEADTDEWLLRLRFRDALRTDAALMQEYADLKRRLLRDHPADRSAYTAGKSSFIERVLAANPRH